jgi:hypothetical protein
MSESAISGPDGQAASGSSVQGSSFEFVKQRNAAEKAHQLSGCFQCPADARRSVCIGHRGVVAPEAIPIPPRVRSLAKLHIHGANAIEIRELRLSHGDGPAAGELVATCEVRSAVSCFFERIFLRTTSTSLVSTGDIESVLSRLKGTQCWSDLQP